MTETLTLKPVFGLIAPEGVTACWGARAIFRDGYVELLHDRQSVAGDETEAHRVVDAMNASHKRGEERVNALQLAKARALKLYDRGKIHGHAAERVRLYEDKGGLVIEANTNGSHGYLYLVAYFEVGATKDSSELVGVSLPPPKAPVKLTIGQLGDLCLVDRYGVAQSGITARALTALDKKGLVDRRVGITKLGLAALAHEKEYGHD